MTTGPQIGAQTPTGAGVAAKRKATAAVQAEEPNRTWSLMKPVLKFRTTSAMKKRSASKSVASIQSTCVLAGQL